MPNIKFWVIFTLVFTLLIIIGASLLNLRGNPAVANYRQDDKEKPRLEIDKLETDLGKIKVSEQKETDFAIKNVGSQPLQLFNISSSCGCVTAKIIKNNGEESSEFGMHSKNKSIVEITPGEQIKIKVTYRPYVMPVRGLVERDVYLSSNDPFNPKLTLKIKAQVYD